jgi:hypothetical protein
MGLLQVMRVSVIQWVFVGLSWLDSLQQQQCRGAAVLERELDQLGHPAYSCRRV